MHEWIIYLVDHHALRSLDVRFEAEETIGVLTTTHLEFAAEELLLKFWDPGTDFAVLILPFVLRSCTMPVPVVACEE